MGMIRKLVMLGAAKKIAGALMKRRSASSESTAGAGAAMAAHSKDTATGAKSGQNPKAAGAKSGH